MNINMVTVDGVELPAYLDGFVATASPMKFDIMVDDRYNGQLVFPCDVGSEYTYDELKMFCRLKRPSLSSREFELLPSGKPKFRQ